VAFILIRHARLMFGVAAAIVLLALLVTSMLSPRYTATAQIMLESRKQNVIGIDALVSDLPFDQATVDSQIALVQSPSLLARVIKQEDLAEDDEFGARRPQSLIAWARTLFSVRSEEQEAQAQINVLREALRVERAGRTFVIAISVTSLSPEKAARIANGIAKAYIVDQLEARYEYARRASDWLGDRLERLRRELRDSESAIARFRAENNLGVAVSGAVSEAHVADLNAKLVEARAESVERRTRLEQAQRIVGNGGNPQSIPDVVRSPIMPALKSQHGQVSQREADLVARYGDRHPLVVNVRAERRDVERQIQAEINRVIANLTHDYEASRIRQEALEKGLGVVVGHRGADNAIAVQLRELERGAAANKTLYESFLSRFKLSEEQANLEVREARIIAPAALPQSPSFPRTGLVAALALIAGLGAGVGSALLMERLRPGFSNPNEVEDELEVPALASIPLLRPQERVANGRFMSPESFVLRKPMSRFSEAIRTVRAGIQMSNVDQPPKVIQVSSIVAGEGKTTVAIALAQSAATSMERVLLIDADLRRPSATKNFRLERRPGLVDMLVGYNNGDEFIVQDPISGIFVLGAGVPTQNPPDLLASDRLRTVIMHLRDRYDYIVVDSPPVGPVIDPVVLSHCVEKVLLVVAWNDTPRDLAARAVCQFPSRKIAGVALNRLDVKDSLRYAEYARSQYCTNYYTG
jgi:exopolysaccharide transport family protein